MTHKKLQKLPKLPLLLLLTIEWKGKENRFAENEM